jgi:hypothetical protein
MPVRELLDAKSERGFFRAAALLFAILVLINFGPVFVGKIPIPGHLVTQFPLWSEFKSRQPAQPVADIGDTIVYFYPFNEFSAQQIRSGTIPLWNPYLMAGMPFQAEPQSAMFYPLHLFYYLFSAPTAWSIALIVRLMLALMFMTLLMRSLGATKAGSIVSAVVFAFGGFLVAWQGAVMGDAVIWLPLVCYSVIRLRRSLSRESIALVAFSFAMPVLAGHPETAIHLILTGIAAALLLWIFPEPGGRSFEPRFILYFGLAGIIAIGLSSIQLVPTLEWVRQSGRGLNALWDGSFPVHQGLGFFSRDALRGPNSAGIAVPNALGYVGMFTLLAAAVAPLHRFPRYVIWFCGLVAIGLAVTFGVEPIHWLVIHTPVIKGLKNERLILLADFGLAALAGFGVSMLQEAQATPLSRTRRILPWLFIGAAFTVSMIAIHKLQLATQFKVEVMRRPSFSRSLLLAGLILVVWKLVRAERAKLFSVVAVLLVVFDLCTFASGYTTFTRRDELFPPAPAFDFLKQQNRAEIFRIMPVGTTYPEDVAMAYGLQTLTGFEAAVPPALQQFVLDFTEGYPESVVPVAEKVLSIPDRRLDMLNVKYVLVSKPSREHELFSQHGDRFVQVFSKDRAVIFENKTALPRAFVVAAAGVRLVQDEAQIETIKSSSFDPIRSVVLDAMPPELAGVGSASEFHGTVEIADKTVNSYRFHVDASTPSVLVVSQNYYPGWHAEVNGRPASVFPADHALTGIAVPAGKSDVDFEFRPSSFKIGAVVSITGFVVFGFVFVSGLRPNRW